MARKKTIASIEAEMEKVKNELKKTISETVYITVYCSKLVCTRFPFRHSPVWFYLCLHDSFFQNTTFVYMNSIAAFRQYYSSFPFIFSSFIMASLEPNTIFC